MILYIHRSTTVDDIQDRFNECFPGFWIEFYDGQHALGKELPAKGYARIIDLSRNHQLGELKIYSLSTAEKIAEDFKSHFGLLIKIFRVRNQHLTELGENESLEADTAPHI